MAKKDKKSIYDRKLKDINKDGKTNFADTWLGDVLGFDGKLGSQGPGMKKSLKGARRVSDEDKPKKETKSAPSKTTSTPKTKAEPSVRLDSKGETPKRRASPSSRLDSKGETPTASQRMAKPEAPRTTPTKPKTPAEDKLSPRAQVIQQKKAERANKPSEKEIQTWLRSRPPSFHLSNDTAAEKREAAIKALTNKTGMSKGGMMKKEGRYQQNGGRDLKKTGMFYKTGSPKGYK